MSDNKPNLANLLAKAKESDVVTKSAPTPQKVTETPKTATPKVPDKLYNVFYNTIQSCKMVTDTGRTISFVTGKYVTDVKEEIEYLQREMSLGSIHLSTKKGEEQLTSAELNPMVALRKQHMKEALAMAGEVARKIAVGEALSESESEVQKLMPASTANTVQGEGSNSLA